MKYAVNRIRLHSFKNFRELTYNVSSGKIFGRGSEGKTNLLSSISALVLNQEIDGSKIHPLTEGVQTGWVDIEWNAEGNTVQSYREWRRTENGYSSTGTPPNFDRLEFLLIHNPLYIFGLSHADRRDLLSDLAYKEIDTSLLSELSTDTEPWVKTFARDFGKLDIKRLRHLLKQNRADVKVLADEIKKLEAQIEVIEDPDLMCDKTSDLDLCNEQLEKLQEQISAIQIIESQLLTNAIEYLNPKMILTVFTVDGRVLHNDRPMEYLSGSELLEAGLDIANMVAGIATGDIPPTVIDNAAMYGKSDIDTDLYSNLSQVITASFANVDLCEFDRGFLVAVDQSWKVLVHEEFRMDVEIEMIPFRSGE